jgi:ribosomal protein S18 acetylase RimI-like enzyme
MDPIHITTYSPSHHAHLLSSLVNIHILTIQHDNAVIRFHPPFTPHKRQQMLDFWTSRLANPEIITLLVLDTSANTASSSTSSTSADADASSTDQSQSQSQNQDQSGNENLVGVVQLLTPLTALDTGPFRAEIEMLMIHPSYRRIGLAKRLMQALETVAMERGRTLLTLGTTKDSIAETKFYPGMGYEVLGVLRGYAYPPDGGVEEDGKGGKERRRVDGVLFWKDLRRSGTIGGKGTGGD